MIMTYAKLADGAWGVRGPGGLPFGTVVFVRKASGALKTEVIAAQIGSGLYTIIRPGTARSRRCVQCGRSTIAAGDYDARPGLCGGCVFDYEHG